MINLGIKEINQKNKQFFVISSSELRVPKSTELIEIILCSEKSYDDQAHRQNCLNCHSVFEKYISYYPESSKKWEIIKKVIYIAEDKKEVEKHVFCFSSETKKTTIPSNWYNFSAELEKEIEIFYNQLSKKEIGLQSPKGIKFLDNSDEKLSLCQKNPAGEKEIKNNFWLILKKECWNNFMNKQKNHKLVENDFKIMYLTKEGNDFLIKSDWKEVLDELAENKNVNKYSKDSLIEKYRLHEKDTGSTALQIILLNEKILREKTHLSKNRKDIPSKRALLRANALVKRHFNYLKKTNLQTFQELKVDLK